MVFQHNWINSTWMVVEVPSYTLSGNRKRGWLEAGWEQHIWNWFHTCTGTLNFSVIYQVFCCWIVLLAFSYIHKVLFLILWVILLMCCKQITIHFCGLVFVKSYSISPSGNICHPDFVLLWAACVNTQLCTMFEPDSPDIVWTAYVKTA